MYSLTTIIALNNIDRRNAENEVTRHCSYTGNVERGLVLHSAKLRSTAFVSAGLYSKLFLAEHAKCKTIAARDAHIEAQF